MTQTHTHVAAAAGKPAQRGSRLLRIGTIRILSQGFFFGAFAGSVIVTSYVHLAENPRLIHWVSKFLEIDPLVGLATLITTRTIYSGLVFSLIVILATIVLGRIFCNWVCPFGTLHHFVGWAFGRWSIKDRIDVNRYRPSYAAKYIILIAMLVAAVFGGLQIGLLDPIATITRSFTTAVMPAVQMSRPGFFGDHRIFQLAWVIGTILLALVGLNLLVPRFFCRVLCPLGALLGVFGRFSLWRIDRDLDKCTRCGLCLTHCEGACDPNTNLRKSECLVCFNCIEDCPHDALHFRYLPPRDTEVANPDLSRRRVVLAGAAGLAFVPLARVAARSTRDFHSYAIRPPGALEEQEFLKRCIKCGQCMRVCPTNVLQPAMLEAGIEGLWTPVMNFRIGFCQLNCTACGQVCPTGAIRRIGVEEKLGLGRYADQGPIRLGLASYDLGRCLPWARATPCVVCEEVCPTSPKAIYSEWMQFVMREGKKMVVAASASTVTLAEFPRGGQINPEPLVMRPNKLRGDASRRHHVKLLHPDGREETHPIVANGVDVVQIEGQFGRVPTRGDIAVLLVELKVPKVDMTRCIGCGLCEYVCVIVGDKRAVYVTAEGESRSQHYTDEKRNRSIRLMKSDEG